MARKKGAICSFILMITEMLSSILFTPFLIRSFGQAEYGIYSLVCSITAYLALLDLGVGNAIVRYMAKYKVSEEDAKQRNLLALTLAFYLVIGIVVILIGIVLKNNMHSIFGRGLNAEEIVRAKQMFSITMLNVSVVLFCSPFEKTMIAFERFVPQKILAIMKLFIRVMISIIVLINGGRGVAIVTVNFVMTLLFGIINAGYVFVRLKVIPKFRGMDFRFIRELVGYSAFIFLQMIATQINAMADQILIGSFVRSSAVILGVYAVGAQINQYYQSIASSINGVLMPGVVGMVEKGATSEELLQEMVRIGRILLMLIGMIWGIFLVAGDKFIVLWAGEKNYQAYVVACILITPMMFTLIQSIGAQILWAKNKHKVQAYLKIAVAVMNIFVTILLIKWNPLIGACIGTAVAITLGDIVVMNIVFTKYIGISMKKYYTGLFKGILPCILISMIIGIIFKIIVHIDGWIGFIIHCLLMVICYGVALFLKGMNNYEKQLLTEMIVKIKRKEENNYV